MLIKHLREIGCVALVQSAFEKVILPKVFATSGNVTTIKQMCKFLASLRSEEQLFTEWKSMIEKGW